MRSSKKTHVLTLAKPDKVAEELERDIRAGKLQYGARLESEHELVRRFSVSRTTVRKGLEALAGKGLITTKVGIGSFVTFNGQTLNDALGWTQALADQEEPVVTQLLSLERIRDEALARQLRLDDPEFIAIDRTRALQRPDRVVSIERSRVPFRHELEHVLTHGLKHGSLAATLRDAGLAPQSGEEWAEIECLSEADARIVDAIAGTPYLRTRRLVRDPEGRVIEYVVSLLDPRHFALHLEF